MASTVSVVHAAVEPMRNSASFSNPLTNDVAADGFCLQPFFATEAAFLAVLFTFNLLSLYQHQTTPDAPYRQPGTWRVAVFLCGAILGVLGRDVVLRLSSAWGGLAQHQPLVEAALNWLKCVSPKLVPPGGSAGYRRGAHLSGGTPVPLKNPGLFRRSGLSINPYATALASKRPFFYFGARVQATEHSATSPM